jgi:hypothetical protein
MEKRGFHLSAPAARLANSSASGRPLEGIRGPRRPVVYNLHVLLMKSTPPRLGFEPRRPSEEQVRLPNQRFHRLRWRAERDRPPCFVAPEHLAHWRAQFPACTAENSLHPRLGNLAEKPLRFSVLARAKCVEFGSIDEFSLHFPA